MAKGFLSGLFGRKKKQEDAEIPSEDIPATEALEDDLVTDETSHDVVGPSENVGDDTPSTLDEDAVSVGTDIARDETGSADVSQVPDGPESQHVTSGEIPEEEIPATQPPIKKGFFARLTAGLAKTSSRLSEGVTSIFTKKKLDDDMLEELEDLLISADLGLAAAGRITAALAKSKFDKEVTDHEVKQALADEVVQTLAPLEQPLVIDETHKPHVILMTGVNGAGKTTTLGKLASKFKSEGKSVMLVAGDTFRAAAIEQLTVWGERTDVPVMAREVGADAAGLAFDALRQAQADNIDVLLVDTAGRLQNKSELMDELAKIIRVLRKIDDTAPHHSLLVLDATVGQNALSQTQAFQETADISGLIMTKLDGTARGGVLVALADQFTLPIHYIGVGEGVDDLQVFSANNFALALAGLEVEKTLH